ncbi:MAG: WYL domain-containing protein [Spirochaetes bacterium]|nr:WYL domain-containing protein [Spirochaetota bacterium]
MADQSKTRRFFDLILWLQKDGRTGLSRERVCDEYQISEKTFSRDVQELVEIFPMAVRYDREEERLYANIALLQKRAESPASAPAPGISQDVPAEAFVIHSGSGAQALEGPEFRVLLESVLEGHAIEFFYREKIRRGVPLFFCHYAERWYLFFLNLADGLILKFRLDQVKNTRRPLLSADKIPADLAARKVAAADRIRRSHNIFVDLNALEPMNLTLRFFFAAPFLREKIPHLGGVSQPDPKDPGVTDVELSFSGYSEARAFLNTWLGHFQILGPRDVRQRYAEELEEALDAL